MVNDYGRIILMIYLLEDDESIRNFVEYALNNSGLESKGFEKPSDFWKAVEERIPNLVLLDVMLPEEDGLEVLKKLGDEGAELAAVEMLADIGPGVFPPIRKYIVADIMSHKPETYTAHKLIEIKDKAVVVESLADGAVKEIPCDNVVVSLGVAPVKGLVEEYEKEFANVVVIGDANKGGRIHNATKDGFTKAYAFDM